MLVFIQKHTCKKHVPYKIIYEYRNTHIYLYIKYIVIHRLGSVKKKIKVKTTKTIKNKTILINIHIL